MTTHHGHSGGSDMSASELTGYLAGCATFPERAIDLGCGTGADAVFLAERGITMTGIDQSEHALSLARDRAAEHDVKVTWIHGDVLQLPIDDATIDLAIDRGCLHHLPASDHEAYAIEVARVLRPGGQLLVREMNGAHHGELAVTEQSLRAMVAATDLQVRRFVSYELVGASRKIRPLLAVFDRTS